LILSRLEKRLEEQTAMTGEAASWAVESWAMALNLATESEIQTRQKTIESGAPPILKKETVQPNDSVAGTTPKVSRPNPIQPPKIPTTLPPINKQSPQTPKPSPPIILPKNKPPINQPSIQPQTTNYPATARRGFGIFRGCLVVIFLLAVASVVLFLGVPYAIEVMRETQRERNNEPPRFPVR
jgi:hypothetical protein